MIRRARVEDLDGMTSLALRSKAAWGYSAEFIESCRGRILPVFELNLVNARAP